MVKYVRRHENMRKWECRVNIDCILKCICASLTWGIKEVFNISHLKMVKIHPNQFFGLILNNLAFWNSFQRGLVILHNNRFLFNQICKKYDKSSKRVWCTACQQQETGNTWLKNTTTLRMGSFYSFTQGFECIQSILGIKFCHLQTLLSIDCNSTVQESS